MNIVATNRNRSSEFETVYEFYNILRNNDWVKGAVNYSSDQVGYKEEIKWCDCGQKSQWQRHLEEKWSTNLFVSI